MLGNKAGSMTLQETSKPIDSGQYGLPAMETNTVGGGKLLGMRDLDRGPLPEKN